jgi:hypothetical protein
MIEDYSSLSGGGETGTSMGKDHKVVIGEIGSRIAELKDILKSSGKVNQ